LYNITLNFEERFDQLAKQLELLGIDASVLEGQTGQDGSFAIDTTYVEKLFDLLGIDASELYVEIGGNAECEDTFTGLKPDGALFSGITRSNYSASTMMVTPMSTAAISWQQSDSSQTIASVDAPTGRYFGTDWPYGGMALKPTQFDQIAALPLGYEMTEKAVNMIAAQAKINTAVSLGAGYISSAKNVTIAEASLLMYQSLGNRVAAEAGGGRFDYSTTTDTLAVIQGAVAAYSDSDAAHRRLQQFGADDLNALANVMLVIFTEIEKKADQLTSGSASIAKVVEEVAKVSIAAETSVMNDVKDLGSGKINSTAFVEDNTAARLKAKEDEVTLPSSFSSSFEALVPPPPPTEPPPPEKDSGSSSNQGLVIGVVCGTLAFSLLIVGGVYASAKHARNKRMAEDSSLPMTIDLSSQLYTPYDKKKQKKKGGKYMAGSSSSLEMTPVAREQMEAFA
jgi:hypothetical protein